MMGGALILNFSLRLIKFGEPVHGVLNLCNNYVPLFRAGRTNS